MKYVGVDGCRGGWFAVCLDEDEASFGAFGRFSALWENLGDAECILVDMPIGLPGKKQQKRAADVLARQFIKGRASSIFPPGVREGLACTSYRDACEINRKLTGKKITKQYWNITPKIKEVDSFLQGTPQALGSVLETHPEVCFKAAAGKPLLFPKRKPEGIEERLAILSRHLENARVLYEKALGAFTRKTVARDDIVDAMILAVTARESRGSLTPMPDPPERDETGLPMAIWYHDFT